MRLKKLAQQDFDAQGAGRLLSFVLGNRLYLLVSRTEETIRLDIYRWEEGWRSIFAAPETYVPANKLSEVLALSEERGTITFPTAGPEGRGLLTLDAEGAVRARLPHQGVAVGILALPDGGFLVQTQDALLCLDEGGLRWRQSLAQRQDRSRRLRLVDGKRSLFLRSGPWFPAQQPCLVEHDTGKSTALDTLPCLLAPEEFVLFPSPEGFITVYASGEEARRCRYDPNFRLLGREAIPSPLPGILHWFLPDPEGWYSIDHAFRPSILTLSRFSFSDGAVRPLLDLTAYNPKLVYSTHPMQRAEDGTFLLNCGLGNSNTLGRLLGVSPQGLVLWDKPYNVKDGGEYSYCCLGALLCTVESRSYSPSTVTMYQMPRL